MNPNIIRGEIHDAVANLSYGHRTAVIVLASIVNDLSYKVGLATLPKPEKQTTGEDTKFDESVATFFKMDGDTGRKTVSFDELVMGFAAAQFLLIDTMNKPDPEAFGRNHADWAKKYLRTPSMIAKNVEETVGRARLRQLEADAAKFTAAGIQVDQGARKQAILDELKNHANVAVEIINGGLRRAVEILKDQNPSDLWELVMQVYDDLGVSMTARVYESITTVIGAQAKRFSENRGFVTLDAGLVELKRRLDPPKPSALQPKPAAA